MERKKVRWGLFLLAVLLCVLAMHRVAEKVRERWEARNKEGIFWCLQARLQKTAEETMAPILSLRSIEPNAWLEEEVTSFWAPVMTMNLDGPSRKMRGDEPSAGEGADTLSDALHQENLFGEAEKENAEYTEVRNKNGEGNALIRIDLEEEQGQSMSGQGEISQAEPDLEGLNQNEQGLEGLNQTEPGQEEFMREEIKQDGLTQEGRLPNKVRTISADAMSTYEELV